MSPQRRRSSGDTLTTISNSTVIVTSPRCGFDSKQRQNNSPQAINDFAGWGVCTIREFAQFSVGDQFVMIIPSDHKNDNKHAIAQRKTLWQRVVTAVATALPNNTTPASAKAPFHKNSNSAQLKNAQQHLLHNHGIERRKLIYIKLRCAIHRYPHRDDYVNCILPISEITTQICQHVGIYVTLLDYPLISSDDSNSISANVFHIRWSKVPFIQVWSQYFRGDYRPPIILSRSIPASGTYQLFL